MAYNGWANRETWLVVVWFDPESIEDVQGAKEFLEDQYDAIPDGPLKDMIGLSNVDWNELEDAFSDEEENEEE